MAIGENSNGSDISCFLFRRQTSLPRRAGRSSSGRDDIRACSRGKAFMTRDFAKTVPGR
jgi:hypothetical protein